MWAEQRDLEDDGMLRAIVGAAGLPEDWVARTQDPEIKARLAYNTSAARDAGVFGVPTYVVDGKHLFWGQDRLDLVARALAGWTPPCPRRYLRLPRLLRRTRLRPRPRLCAADLRAFIRRPLSRRFCLNFGRSLSFVFVRRPDAMRELSTKPLVRASPGEL